MSKKNNIEFQKKNLSLDSTIEEANVNEEVNVDSTIEETNVNEEVNVDSTIEEANVNEKKYIVVYPFMDLEDSKHIYKVNNFYPHENISEKNKINALSEERIKSLTTKDNKIGEILIEEYKNEE